MTERLKNNNLVGDFFLCERASLPFLVAWGAVNHGGPLSCGNGMEPGLVNDSGQFPWSIPLTTVISSGMDM